MSGDPVPVDPRREQIARALRYDRYDAMIPTDELVAAVLAVFPDEGRYEQIGGWVIDGRFGAPHMWEADCDEEGCVPVFRRVSGDERNER